MSRRNISLFEAAIKAPWQINLGIAVVCWLIGLGVRYIHVGGYFHFEGAFSILFWAFAVLLVIAAGISYLNQRLEKGAGNTNLSALRSGDHVPVCKHCGKTMVMRVANRGANPGARFWGCANYPACRYTLPIQDIHQ